MRYSALALPLVLCVGCYRNSSLDGLFATHRLFFVRFHIMSVTDLDIILNDPRQLMLTITPAGRGLANNLVAHPAVNHATNQIPSVKFIWESEFNPAGVVQSL